MATKQDAATLAAEAAGSEDPATGLAAESALRGLLESLQVTHAREKGWSWQEIAQPARREQAGRAPEARPGQGCGPGEVAAMVRCTQPAGELPALAVEEAERLGHRYLDSRASPAGLLRQEDPPPRTSSGRTP